MSKPTTPNSARRNRRHLQRSSGVFGLLPQSPKIHYPVDADNLPLESPLNLEKFEQLSDSMEELESNMTGLQRIHSAISGGFNESFASFLYGLSMTMWCVDFPGTPSKAQWEKLNDSNEIEERISDLQQQINLLKQENDTLKIKISNKQKLKPNVLKTIKKNVNTDDDTLNTSESSFINMPTKTPLKQQQQQRQQQQQMRSFNSSSNSNIPASSIGRFHTKSSQARLAQTQARLAAQAKSKNSSVSRIPQRPPPKSAIPRFNLPGIQPKRVGTGPNLNQRPRYLDGLFDKKPNPPKNRSPVNRSYR